MLTTIDEGDEIEDNPADLPTHEPERTTEEEVGPYI